MQAVRLAACIFFCGIFIKWVDICVSSCYTCIRLEQHTKLGDFGYG